MPKAQATKKSYQTSYVWAANPLKLHEAITDLERAKRDDPRIEISETTIKEQYLVRKGRLLKLAKPSTAPKNADNSHQDSDLDDDDDESEDTVADSLENKPEVKQIEE